MFEDSTQGCWLDLLGESCARRRRSPLLALSRPVNPPSNIFTYLPSSSSFLPTLACLADSYNSVLSVQIRRPQHIFHFLHAREPSQARCRRKGNSPGVSRAWILSCATFLSSHPQRAQHAPRETLPHRNYCATHIHEISVQDTYYLVRVLSHDKSMLFFGRDWRNFQHGLTSSASYCCSIKKHIFVVCFISSTASSRKKILQVWKCALLWNYQISKTPWHNKDIWNDN